MRQRCEEARLLQQIAKIDVLPVRNLDGNLLVDPRVFGQVHGAEAATAKWREDFVLSNRLAAEEHGRSIQAPLGRIRASAFWPRIHRCTDSLCRIFPIREQCDCPMTKR